MSADQPAGENGRGRLWAALAAIMLAAALLRVAVTVEHSRSPLFEHLRLDEEFYDAWAAEALEGRWFLDYVSNHGPGYPWFLAGVYAVFGRGPLGVRIAQSLLGVLSCLLAFLLGRRLFGDRAGLLAALLCGFYWPFIIFEQRVLAVAPIVFLDLAGILLFARAMEKPGLPSFLAAGAVTGLSMIARPTAMPWALAATALAVWHGLRGERKVLAGGAAYLAAVGLTIAPVIVKNHSISGDWGLIQINAGMNIYLGNNPESDGTPYARPGGVWDRVQAMPVAEAGTHDPRGQDRFYLDQVAAFIRESPGRFLLLQLRKLAMLVNRVEVRSTLDPEFHRKQLWALAPPWPGFGIVFGLALAGLAALRRGRRGQTVLLLFLLAQGGMVVASVVASRYRAPFAAGVIILAGAGAERVMVAVLELVRKKSLTAAPLFLLAGGLAMAALPAAPRYSDAEELTYLGDAWVIQGDAARAAENYKKALAEDPNFSQAMIGIASLYKTDNNPAAREWFRRAVEADPQSARARFVWGLALWEQGEKEEALRQMETGLKFRPQWVPGLFILAQHEALAGKTEAAAGHLEHALRLRPEYEEARDLLRQLRSNQGGQLP